MDGGLNTFGYAYQNPTKNVDRTGLKVYRCWGPIHPTIKIENSDSSCSADDVDSINGEWGFGAAAGNPQRIFKSYYWQAGMVYAESGASLWCNLVFDGDSMDQFVYDRIMKDAIDPPAYHLYWFNSIHWSNNILFDGNSWQRGVADRQQE